MMILFLVGVSWGTFYLWGISFSCRLNVKAFISNVKTALAATNPVSKFRILILNYCQSVILKAECFCLLPVRL